MIFKEKEVLLLLRVTMRSNSFTDIAGYTYIKSTYLRPFINVNETKLAENLEENNHRMNVFSLSQPPKGLRQPRQGKGLPLRGVSQPV